MLTPLDRSIQFPDNFVWGVATAAFQIEGASTADGKGPSIWDTFCAQPGTIADASNGDVACDHYHRWPADLDLIASLGVDAYRFSTSWARVMPDGRGGWNEKGLAFYDRLVDGMLERGLKPYLTLNHWDLPAALQSRGGWANRETVEHFVNYACGMTHLLGDRVVSITTHNEPWVIAMLGHDNGIFAPGIKDRSVAFQAAHHLLLSHGQALVAMRQMHCKAKVGIVLNLAPMHPASGSAEDAALTRLEDGKLLRWYMDALFGRGYPIDVMDHLGGDAPRVASGDMAAIAQPLDFLGINYYSRSVISTAGPWDTSRGGLPITDMGWEIYPQGLTELLTRLHRDYPLPPTYITENGAAFADQVVQGRVHDPDRVSYLRDHIAAVADAVRQGVPVSGYFVWSLLDNFEWNFGYSKRFGIVHVDYENQTRTLKESGLWFRDFLREAGAARAQRVLSLRTGT